VNSSFLETIKSIDGKLFHMPYHQKRYERVLNSFGIKKYENLNDYLNPPTDGIYRCRVVYSLSNLKIINVEYYKYKKRKIESIKLVYDDKIDYAFKSTCRDEIDKLFSKKEECNDILIVKNSLITDTSIANIALYKDGIWFTPKHPLLKGTTRERLLDEGKIVQADIKVEDLKNFSKVALLNAMIDFDIISKITFKN